MKKIKSSLYTGAYVCKLCTDAALLMCHQLSQKCWSKYTIRVSAIINL